MKKPRFLTATRVSYMVMASLCLGFVFAAGGRIPYGAALMALGILPVSLLYAWLVSRCMRVRIRLDSVSGVRGTAVQCRILAENNGLLATPWFGFHLTCTPDLAGVTQECANNALPFSVAHWSMELRPKHRGEMRITADKLRCADLFRLTHFACKKTTDAVYLSLPVLREPEELLRLRLNALTEGGRVTLNTDEAAVDARPYQPGDPVRRIHWNLTARSQEVMVRRFENQSRRQVACLLDLQHHNASLYCEDALIEHCLAVLRYALSQETPVVLVYGEKGQVRRFSGENMMIFTGVYEALARARFEAGMPPSALLSHCGDCQYIMWFCIGAAKNSELSQIPTGVLTDVCEIADGKPAPKRGDTESLRFLQLSAENATAEGTEP